MKHQFALFAAVALLPSLAQAQKVRFDYDHGTNFTMFHTYRMVKIADNPAVNQLYDQRILSAIEEELAKKGLRRVEEGGDVLVGYQASVDKQTQYTTFNNGAGPGWGWGSGISTTTSSTIPVGALMIDIMDPSKKQLIWRGTATDTLSDKPEKNTEKINKAVKKMFDKYPPKA